MTKGPRQERSTEGGLYGFGGAGGSGCFLKVVVVLQAELLP
jgi:hypothetical protein